MDSEAARAAVMEDEATVPHCEAVVDSEAAVAAATTVEEEAMVPRCEAVVDSEAAGAAATTLPVGTAVRPQHVPSCIGAERVAHRILASHSLKFRALAPI